MNTSTEHQEPSLATALPRVPIWRHLCAMFYDLFLIIPLLMLTSALLIAIHGPTDTAVVRSVPAWQQWILTYLALVGFFGLFWRQKGQTLGYASMARKACFASQQCPCSLVARVYSYRHCRRAGHPSAVALLILQHQQRIDSGLCDRSDYCRHGFLLALVQHRAAVLARSALEH